MKHLNISYIPILHKNGDFLKQISVAEITALFHNLTVGAVRKWRERARYIKGKKGERSREDSRIRV
jgi:hypothetical protein